MSLTKHVPNAITCGNLICGLIAITQIASGQLDFILPLLLFAAVLDFADGLAARALKAYSAIGKDLDSLADCVTFGVVPSLYTLAVLQANNFGNFSYLAFGIAAFSALRLAIFNNDTRQSEGFIGVPTPANALLIVSATGLAHYLESNFGWFMLFLTITSPLLMVMNVPLIALKFKNLNYNTNKPKFILVILSITTALLGITFLNYQASLFLIIVAYITFSIFNNLFYKK